MNTVETSIAEKYTTYSSLALNPIRNIHNQSETEADQTISVYSFNFRTFKFNQGH